MSSSKSDAPQPGDSNEPVPAFLKPGYSIDSAMKKWKDPRLAFQGPDEIKRNGFANKNFKAFVRMNGYKRPPPCFSELGAAHTMVEEVLPGRPGRIIYEPPLVDNYSDLHYPMIKYASLALESYNKREGTNYNYVGLLKAYAGEHFAEDYDIHFTASLPLVSDFDDVAFHAKISPPADSDSPFGIWIEKLSTPPQFSLPWLVTQPKPQ